MGEIISFGEQFDNGVKELKSNFRCADCILVNQIEQTALHIDSCITKPDLTMAERYFTPKVGVPYLWSPVSSLFLLTQNNILFNFFIQDYYIKGLGRQQQHPHQPHPHWAHQKLEPLDNCQPSFSVLPTYSDNRRQQHQQQQSDFNNTPAHVHLHSHPSQTIFLSKSFWNPLLPSLKIPRPIIQIREATQICKSNNSSED
uniref:Uncharacterized protein n=1 Tax=Glossina palpalis gambiensis TaxID=67801 RepID=A0A1B0C2X3_9MUSC